MKRALNDVVQFHDFEPETSDFLEEVKKGLSRRPKKIAPKFFYDQRGSELFDEICRTREYYPTRTEVGILQQNSSEIAQLIGPDCMLVELGSGASEKVRLLFDALEPASYLGVDISREFLLLATRKLARDYPWLDVHAVCADFSHKLELPNHCTSERIVAFFPGSSIGNFEPLQAVSFLKQVSNAVGEGGELLIGVDLKKNREILESAYNDASGVTDAFNKNILHRMQHELDAKIDLDSFSHQAFYNEVEGCVEMHLINESGHEIELDGNVYDFESGETIHTECSYKYGIEEFVSLAGRAGFESRRVWIDENQLFSVHLLVAV